MYAAVSCSDKTIAIFDFETGDCEAAVYGHSGLFSILYVEQPPEVFCKEKCYKIFCNIVRKTSDKHLYIQDIFQRFSFLSTETLNENGRFMYFKIYDRKLFVLF